jgi:hypothetical protein
VLEVHAAQSRVDNPILGGLLLKAARRAFQVQSYSGRKHLDMSEFLCRGVQEHVAVFLWAASPHRLEEVLHCDPDLPLHAANCLLESARKQWIGTVDTNGVLQLAIRIEHVELLG